jgi:hypothetical protein
MPCSGVPAKPAHPVYARDGVGPKAVSLLSEGLFVDLEGQTMVQPRQIPFGNETPVALGSRWEELTPPESAARAISPIAGRESDPLSGRRPIAGALSNSAAV